MHQHLPTKFQIAQIAIALCKQTLFLLFGVCFGRILWQWLIALEPLQTIVSLLLSSLGNGLLITGFVIFLGVLLILLLLNEIFGNKYRLYTLFAPIILGEYALAYHFNWPALGIYICGMCIMFDVSGWLIVVYILLLNSTTFWMLLYRKEQIDSIFLSHDNPQETTGFLKDTPIQDLEQDSLERKDFVKTFYNIINNSFNNHNIILLHGLWGYGKTSILRCVKTYAEEIKTNNLVFRWVNPWQNDTKQRFVTALLEEINMFLQYTYPKDIISQSLLDQLSFSLQPIPFLNINILHSSKGHNIEVNVQELSNKLKIKKNRLVIVVDDLDRLTKPQVLDILASIHLFSICHNIIFILSANTDKVEDLLTECQSNKKTNEVHSSYNAYQGYLEKIATNIVPLPDILPEVLRNNLFLLLEKTKSSYPITQEEKDSIPASLFHNLRDIKRVLQEFSNVMQQSSIQGEINTYHMLLATMLYIFAPKVYKAIPEHPAYWIEEDVQSWTHKMEENYSQLKAYFESLLAIYPEKRREVETIFLILNPEYHNIKSWEELKHKTTNIIPAETVMGIHFSKNISKPFYNRDYFYRYFTHQPNKYTIPDKLMLAHIEKLQTLLPQNGAEEVLHMLTRCSQAQLSSYFNYLHNNDPFKDNEQIYSAIANGLILLLNSDNIKNEVKKLILEEHISQWIIKGEVPIHIVVHIFDKLNSILFKTHIYCTAKNNSALFKQLRFSETNNYSLDDIVKEMEKYIEFKYARSLVYLWMSDWQYKSSYNEIKQRQLLLLFKQNEHYFWLIIGKNLYESIDSYILFEKTTPWGLETLNDIITNLLKNTHLEHKKELLSLQKTLNKFMTQKNITNK